LTFRHGDSQLIVLIPDCDVETGQAVAERVTSSTVHALKGEGMAIRIGFACAPADGDTLSELVQAAQSRLRRQRSSSAALAVIKPTDPDALPGPQAIPA
jgi:GGDEF domain-containing protein